MKNHPSLATLVAFATILVAGCNTPTTPPAPVTNITVTYHEPEKFTDAQSTFGSGYDQSYLDQLSNELKRTAKQYVKADQKLDVTVTDVDLAGEFNPSRSGLNDVRIIKEIYRPRIALTFKLTGADGKVIKEGDRTLTDSYFMTNVLTVNRDEPLFYDKNLIATWVRDEFKP